MKTVKHLISWMFIDLLLLAGTTSGHARSNTVPTEPSNITIPQNLWDWFRENGEMRNENNENRDSLTKDFWDWFRREGHRGSTQGEFCSIAPSYESSTIWNTQPVFVWQGTVLQIEVTDGNTGDLMWLHELTPQEQIEQRVTYNGNPLLPGSWYFYEITYENDAGAEDSLAFSLVILEEGDRRQQITNDLAELEAQPDTTLDDYIDYFQAQNLFLDIVQILFNSNTSLSAEEMQSLQEVYCQPNE